MMRRKIIKIHEDRCNGCGACVHACHEKAIELVDGKARLVSDRYCDGLGDCLPACPVDAIEIIEREAEPYSEEAVQERIQACEGTKCRGVEKSLPCGCPGTMARKIEREGAVNKEQDQAKQTVNKDTRAGTLEMPGSELRQWPVQLKLVNPKSDYFQGANLLVAADCTAYAYAGFHRDFIKNHVVVIGCPKLDDLSYYRDKLTEILSQNELNSITVVRMEVPCCNGIVTAVRDAMLNSRTIVTYREVVITIDGEIK